MKKSDKEKASQLVRANVNKGVTKKENKKAGVIQTLINLLANGVETRESLIEKLASIFPERDKTSIASTVKAQLSGKNGTRLERERGLEIKKRTITTIEGKFEGFSIKGFKDWSLQDEEENEE